MAEETGPIELPSSDDIGSYTPEQAQSAWNKLQATPAFTSTYYNPAGSNHPQRAEMQNTVDALFKAMHPPKSDDGLTPMQRTMKEAMDEQSQAQDQRSAHIEQMYDELSELGVEVDYREIDNKVTPSEEKAVETLLAAKKGDWQKVDGILRQVIAPRSIPREIEELWSLYQQIPPEEAALKYNAALPIIQHLRDSDRVRMGLGPRKPADDEKDPDARWARTLQDLENGTYGERK